MTADVSWKSTLAVVPPVMLVNGQGLVYVPEPIAVGAAPNSAGYLEHTKVSWRKRVRRKAMFAKYWAMSPGSVRIPAVGAPLAQRAAVNVPLAKVGQVFVAAVKRSVYGRSSTTTCAANVAAVS